MREKGAGQDKWGSLVRVSGGDRAGWMKKCGEERGGAGLYGWGSGVSERTGGGAEWMGEWGEGERKCQGWMEG